MAQLVQWAQGPHEQRTCMRPEGGMRTLLLVSLLLPPLSLNAADAAMQLHARPTMMRLQATTWHQTKHQHKGINLAPGSEGGWADVHAHAGPWIPSPRNRHQRGDIGH